MKKVFLPGSLALGGLLLAVGVMAASGSSAPLTVRDRSCYAKILRDDMTLPHEGVMLGVPDYYSWAKEPRIGMGNSPEKDGKKWHAAMPLGAIFEGSNNRASNSRIQLRNIQGYYLSRKTNQWVLISQSETVGGANFVADFKDNRHVPPDVRPEPSGGTSIKLHHMDDTYFNYHFWARERGSIDPDDIAAVFASVEARLVVDDPSKPDDRHKAEYLGNAGLDYWSSLNAEWDQFKTNGDAFLGRKRKLSRRWTTLTGSSLTPKQLAQNPPPYQGEFCF